MEVSNYQKKVKPLSTLTPRSSIKVTVIRTPNQEQQSLFVQKLEEIIRESKAA